MVYVFLSPLLEHKFTIFEGNFPRPDPHGGHYPSTDFEKSEGHRDSSFHAVLCGPGSRVSHASGQSWKFGAVLFLRIIFLITENGYGRQIQASIPATASLLPTRTDPSQLNGVLLQEPSPAIQLTSLLGGAPSADLQTLQFLYASQIATIIWTAESQMGLENCRRSVVIGLALAKSNEQETDEGSSQREVFEGVISMVHMLLNGK